MNIAHATNQAEKVQHLHLEDKQYLTFVLAGETFGTDIQHIKEITEYSAITPVPLMPSFITGVTNLRGNVVPVIDLSVRFNSKPIVPGKRTSIIIIELGSEDEKLMIGVVVDEVSEVLDLSANQIEPAPAFGAKIRTDFISGMGKVNEQFLVLLDVEQVLSIDELSSVRDLNRH